jgi:hypothetical protein
MGAFFLDEYQKTSVWPKNYILNHSFSNTLGQLIYSKELNSSNNAISLDGVDKGIYIMSLTSPTQSLKTRIVID